MINVEILSNDFIKISDNIVADSVLHQKIKFTFPEHWENAVKTAVFKNGNTVLNVVLDSDNLLYVSEDVYYIPHEVIKAPDFTVSVFGVLGDSVLTSDVGVVNVRESGMLAGASPAEPTPNKYAQLLNICNETKQIAQSVRVDADNGVFKGDKGDTGNVMFATFDIDLLTGLLIMTTPDGYTGPSFTLKENGHLEVNI